MLKHGEGCDGKDPAADLPALKLIRAGLQRATETLARELAHPSDRAPQWNPLEWRLARAAAAAHGVSPLLATTLKWQGPQDWQHFLLAQRQHTADRQKRIVDLLQQIDAGARAEGIAIVPLKGSALHELGVYAAGERPMADLDLLVRDSDVEPVVRLLRTWGYEDSFSNWRHRVLRVATGAPSRELGEHRDNPVTIEVHTRILERLPSSEMEITGRIFPQSAHSGLNRYPSLASLMAHLLLHTAGNMRNQGIRLLLLHDIMRLSSRMSANDWDQLFPPSANDSIWWALPPLRLVARYYRDVIPETILSRVGRHCPWPLRLISRHHTLTALSCSNLWLKAFPGIEWSRSIREMLRYVIDRVKPSAETMRDRATLARTQLWTAQSNWATLPHQRRIWRWLTARPTRMDAMYVVRASLRS